MSIPNVATNEVILDSMNMHDTLTKAMSKRKDLIIMRVPNGWIYTQTLYDNDRINVLYCTSVFVPIDPII
jgi:hypothetical protein